MENREKRIIVDVDIGIDDAYALLILLHAEKLKKIKIEAITLSFGNSTIENVSKNLIRFLNLLNRTDIPIYKGASNAIISKKDNFSPTHFGEDGFADLLYKNDPDLHLIRKETAAIAIRDIVFKYPKEITLICLAPLTNLAIAGLLSEEVVTSNIKEIFIMGGNYMGVGNITSSAEYNFYMDPEAAFIILDKFKCPITIFPFETGINTKIDKEWRFEILGKIETPHMKLLNEAEKKIYSKKTIRKSIWYPFDAFLAAAVLYPDLIIEEANNYHCTIELFGKFTRGQMVLDHLNKQKPNVCLIEKINIDNFKKLIFEVMTNNY